MKNKKIVFFGAMSAILINAGAAVADVTPHYQIACKAYVDAQDTIMVSDINDVLATKANTADLGTLATMNTVGTTEIDDASVTKPKLSVDVQATLDKADTALQSADLTGYATTTDLSGKADVTYVDAQDATLSTAIATKADTTYVDTQDTALSTAIAAKADQATTYTKTEVDTALADKASTTYVDTQDAALSTAIAAKADTTYVDTAVSTKADTTYVDTQDAALTTAIAAKADTTYVDTGLATKADQATTYTKTEVDTALSDKANISDLDEYTTIEDFDAGLAEKEDVVNKSDNIVTDTGSKTKYTTVNAVETYAVPKPSAECLGLQAQCVLTIDKTTGSIYWEDVAMPVK